MNHSGIGDNHGGGDIKMNSVELQRVFHSVYKDFFNTHDIVLSGNAVLSWGADISRGFSSLHIKQKIPLKSFCGININNSGKITLGVVLYYSTSDVSYKTEVFSGLFKYDIAKITGFIQDFFDMNNYTGGIDIDFLMETPPGHGFGSSAAISVLLTTMLYIVVGKLDPTTFSNRELLVDHPLFEDMYNSSVQLSHCISNGKTTGANNFTIMATDVGSLPVVCLSKEYLLGSPDGSSSQFISTVFYKNSINKFLSIEKNASYIPLDYGILFTGVEHNMLGEMSLKKERVKRDDQKLINFVEDIVARLSIADSERENIINILKFDDNEISSKTIDGTNFKILQGFYNLLINNYDDAVADDFIEVMKSISFMSFSYQKANKLFFKIQYLFHKYQQFENEDIALLPFNTGKIGGSYLFVIKDGKSRVTFEKVLAHLRGDGQSVSLDYASWRDGCCPDGVRIEQHISEKIYSEYTKEGDIAFSDSYGNSYCADYHTVLSNENNCILLDTVAGRIYIQGIKLTSKEIHSQNTTIDMLKLLLENMGQEVSNARLPVSTYSQNKNEILGKIVLPLKKITKENFGSEISLSCSGGITDYYLRLEKDDTIRIGIIRKLQG